MNQKFPKTASPKAESRAVVVSKTQEQLVEELSLITRQATGTQSHDVADRIIAQVAAAQVWLEHVHVHSGGQAVVGTVAAPNQEQEK